MNKILFATRLAITVFGFILINAPLSASDSSLYDENEATIIQDRINNLSSIVDVQYTSEVAKRIDQYTRLGKKDSEILLGKISIYFPIFEKALREKGMPDDLKYLPIIESGLRPSVVSRAGAAGLWQFMKATGRMYDLKVNKTIDERRDPQKATKAAVEYLEYLYNRFGDWTLALAAYNCGPGNVSKAIRKGNSKDFWKIKKFLPRETRNYVPKFIAVTYLMNYYHLHDINPVAPSRELQYTATARVYDKVSFRTLSKELNLDLKVIRTLNPSFIRNYIPANDGKFLLTLPEQKMYTFLGNDKGMQQLVYPTAPVVVKKKPTVVLRQLIQIEALKGQYKTQVNEQGPDQSATHLAQKMAASLQRNNGEKVYKKLGRKESLMDVSKASGVDLKTLIKLNNIKSEADLKPGTVIRVN